MTHVVNGKQSTDEQRMRGGGGPRSEAALLALREKAAKQIRAINRRDAETQRGAE